MHHLRHRRLPPRNAETKMVGTLLFIHYSLEILEIRTRPTQIRKMELLGKVCYMENHSFKHNGLPKCSLPKHYLYSNPRGLLIVHYFQSSEASVIKLERRNSYVCTHTYSRQGSTHKSGKES